MEETNNKKFILIFGLVAIFMAAFALMPGGPGAHLVDRFKSSPPAKPSQLIDANTVIIPLGTVEDNKIVGRITLVEALNSLNDGLATTTEKIAKKFEEQDKIIKYLLDEINKLKVQP